MTKLDIQNVIIRNLNDEDREAIAFAMKETGTRQASKALLRVCKAYQRMVLLYRKIKDENLRLQKENRELKEAAHEVLSGKEKIRNIILASHKS